MFLRDVIRVNAKIDWKRYRVFSYALIMLGMCTAILIQPRSGSVSVINIATGVHPIVIAVWFFLSGVMLIFDNLRGAPVNAAWIGSFVVYSSVTLYWFIDMFPTQPVIALPLYVGISVWGIIEWLQDAVSTYS